MATRLIPEPPAEEMFPELPPGEAQTAAEKIVEKTPWWAISVGLHALVILILSFAIVITFRADDADAVVVSTPRKKPEPPKMTEPVAPHQIKKPTIDKPTPKDPVFKKEAEKADHTETADEEEFRKAKGDSLDFISNKPFKGYGVNDAIGTAGGGGGRYGTRFGGMRELATQEGGGGGTEDSLTDALRWLARHQNPDGSWSVAGYTAHCNRVLPDGNSFGGGPCSPNPGYPDYDAGVTGLSLLAFLGAGHSHLSKEVFDGICFGDVVRKGLQWLMSHQDPEGLIGPREGNYMYNHSICTFALSEALGLTGSNLVKNQAQKAVDFLVAAQNEGKGWRYSFKCGDNDSSVTGWCVMALKSAELSNLSFPPRAYEGARKWLDEVTDDNYYRTGYTYRGTGPVFTPENKNFDHHEALTAISVMCRIFMDKSVRDPRIRGGIELLMRDLPKYGGNATDFYYWYNGSMALFQYDPSKGPNWTRWNKAMKQALVKNQNTRSTGCRNGSWEPISRWSCEGGRVYATAINALTLEVYFRFGNVISDKR